jgi:serine/threonine-protein kinase RsbW
MCVCKLDNESLAPVFHFMVESRLARLDDIVRRILEIARGLPCMLEDLEGIGLALSEALANAIEHGNREDPSKMVWICGGCNGKQLLIAITDEGAGFDPGLLPDPTQGDRLFSSHGRGVFLMRKLTDRTEFRFGGRQVVLRMRALPCRGLRR